MSLPSRIRTARESAILHIAAVAMDAVRRTALSGGVSIWAEVRKRALAAMAGPALLIVAAGAPAEAPTAPPAPETVPVALDVAGRMTTPVFVNGQGPFRFMIDTGANRSAVSRALAAQLGLEVTAPEQVHTFTGPVQAPIARVASLNVGDVIGIRDALLPVLGGPVLAGAAGVLGADALATHRLVMDMRRRVVSIESADQNLRGGRWRRVSARIRFGNLVMCDGLVAGVPTHIVIDTGAEHSFANLALVEAIQGRNVLTRPPTGTRLVSVGRPIMIENLLFLPKASIGDLDISNVTAYAGDIYVFQIWNVTQEPALVLGMDVWGSVDGLAIDYQRGRVYVRVKATPAPSILMH